MIFRKLAAMVAASMVTMMLGMAPASAQVKIGYAPSVWDPSDFHGMMGSGIEAGLKELGVNYRFLIRAPSNHVAHEEQLAIVEKLIAERVDYIIINPTDPLVQRVAYEKVIKSGIPLIVGNYSNPFPKEWGFQPLMFSGYSHEDAGVNLANYLHKKHGTGTKIAVIHGSPGFITSARAPKKLYDQLGMKIVYEDHADFDRLKAYNVMERILVAHPDVNVIVATSSAMAVGAVEATVANRAGKKYAIYGAGGTLEELKYIEDGLLAAAWIRDPVEMGKAVAKAINSHMKGKKSEIPPIYNSPIWMIDSVGAINKHVNPAIYKAAKMDFPRPLKK